MNLPLTLTQFILLFFFVLYLLRYYAGPTVPPLAKGAVFVSWLAGFSGIIVLCADIATTQIEGAEDGSDNNTQGSSSGGANGGTTTSSNSGDDGGDSSSSKWGFQEAWAAIYWVTFFLAWVGVPVINEYLQAGAFTPMARLRSSLHTNLRWYLVTGCVGVLGVLYILITSKANVNDVLGYLITLANSYGLVLIVLLLGHGLVEVPRRLWEDADAGRRLQRLYIQAAFVETELFDVTCALEDVENEIAALHETLHARSDVVVDPRLRGLLDMMEQSREQFEFATDSRRRPSASSAASASSAGGGGSGIDPNRLTEEDLVALNRSLRSAQERVVSEKRRWQHIVDEAEMAQHLDGGTLPYPEHVTEANQGSVDAFISLIGHWFDVAQWHWRWRLSAGMMRGAAVICAGMSAMILWCEVTLWTSWNLSPFGHMLAATNTKVGVQLLSLLPLLYMSICTFWSLFRLRLMGMMELHGPRLSNAGPLLYNAQFHTRLQFPLCYNFLLALKYGPSADTAFADLMKSMRVVPILGHSFNVYAPILLVILSLFTFYRGYGRLLNAIGIENEDAHTAAAFAAADSGRGSTVAGGGSGGDANGGGDGPSSGPSSSSSSSSSRRGMNSSFVDKVAQGRMLIQHAISKRERDVQRRADQQHRQSRLQQFQQSAARGAPGPTTAAAAATLGMAPIYAPLHAGPGPGQGSGPSAGMGGGRIDDNDDLEFGGGTGRRPFS